MQDSKMSRISFHSELKQPFATLSPTLEIALTARSEVILVPIGCDRQRETSEEGAKRAADPGKVVCFRARVGHVMAALGGQDLEACTRDSFRKLV